MDIYSTPGAAQSAQGSSHDAFIQQDSLTQKANLIVPLDLVLEEESYSHAQQGRHRHILPETLRSIQRKRIVGYIATILIAFGFTWYLFVGSDLAITHAQAVSASVEETSLTSRESRLEEAPATSTKDTDSPVFRDNSRAVKTTLGEGIWTVGRDIPRGRYIISALRGTGNISSVKANGTRGVNEIFTAALRTSLRVHTVTTDLEEGEVITIEQLGTVSFLPAPASMTTALSSGTWITGFDVPAGSYVVTNANQGEQGTISIVVDGKVVKNEILGTVGGVGRDSLPLEISEGQTVTIHGLNNVVFVANK